MSAADDVENEVLGVADVHNATFFAGIPGAEVKLRTIQQKLTVFFGDWSNGHTDYDYGRVNGAGQPVTSRAYSMRDSIKRILWEQTAWLPHRQLNELRTKQALTDTLLGHAVNASSAATMALELLIELAKESNLDPEKIKRITGTSQSFDEFKGVK